MTTDPQVTNTNTTTNPGEVKLRDFTREEVKKHNKEGDAWIIFNGHVYDVTKFLKLHPGGVNIVLEYLGDDCTHTLKNADIHRHSKSAYDLLASYKIGKLLSDENTPKNEDAEETTTADIKDVQKLVDFSQPVLPQVAKLGSSYQKWVHVPQNTGPNGLYMFAKSGFLETNTRTPWYVIPIAWGPIMLYSLVAAWLQDTCCPLLALLSLVIGVFIWAVMEYSIHRWAFHMDTSSPLANMIHFMLHGIHHIDPLDRTRLVFPPLPAILAVYIPATYLSSFVITNYSIRHYMTAGAIFGYITYDMTHYILHHGLEGAFVRPLQFLRHCHNHHHFFEGGEKYNFGISFPAKLIDYIMGTHYLPPNTTTTTTTTTNSTEAEAGTAKASSS